MFYLSQPIIRGPVTIVPSTIATSVATSATEYDQSKQIEDASEDEMICHSSLGNISEMNNDDDSSETP